MNAALWLLPVGPAALRASIAVMAAEHAPSKFAALMPGEDVVTGFELDPVDVRPLEWRPHGSPCGGFGSAELVSAIVDPAVSTAPREIFLLRNLLSGDEIDALLSRFQSLHGATAHDPSHRARVLVEDGRVACPDLHALLSPALETRILPYVRARLGDSRVVVADALIRAYRYDDRQQALPPHFDVTAYATVILPLNPGNYKGGLYIQQGASRTSRVFVDPTFQKGDALFHRFQVMHGVEVTAGSRYSLVLWLSDGAESVRAGATPWLKVEADRGDVYAQFLYAEACRTGAHGVPKNVEDSIRFQARAASQGHALSQHRLGMLYSMGGAESGVPQSDETCLRLWRAAAAAGLASAQMSVASAYWNGALGLRRDRERARVWLGKAARQGHLEAALMLRGPRRTEHGGGGEGNL